MSLMLALTEPTGEEKIHADNASANTAYYCSDCGVPVFRKAFKNKEDSYYFCCY